MDTNSTISLEATSTESLGISINPLMHQTNHFKNDTFHETIEGLHIFLEQKKGESYQDDATFNLTFWDKTICSFGSNDFKKVQLFLNFTEHLSVVFGWVFLTLINTWILRDVSFRAEWVMLVLFSLLPFYHAARISYLDFFTLVLIHAILDAAAGTTIFHVYPHIDTSWLCIFIDFFTYLNTLGSIRGFTLQTWLYVLLFTYMNYAIDSHLFASGASFFLSMHAIGHSAFLGLGEVLVQIILLRNQNFSNPIFGLDKSEIIHKFQYLRLSGKLEKVTLPPNDPKIEIPNPKQKRRNQPSYRKNTSSKSKLPGENPEGQSILMPSMGEIADSFELCSLDASPTTLTISWFIPINFLYFLSKSNDVFKELDDLDHRCSRHHYGDDWDCSLSDLEVLKLIEVVVRVNGQIWPHWILSKDGTSITLVGLLPATHYRVILTFIGFRSSPLFLTTKSFKNETEDTYKSNYSYAKMIGVFTHLEQQVNDERKLKKDELASLKKLRKVFANSEHSITQELQRLINQIDKIQHEESKLFDFKDTLIQSLSEIKDACVQKEQDLAIMEASSKDLKDTAETKTTLISTLVNQIQEAKSLLNSKESELKEKIYILENKVRDFINSRNMLKKQIAQIEQANKLIEDDFTNTIIKIEQARTKLIEVDQNYKEILSFKNGVDTLGISQLTQAKLEKLGLEYGIAKKEISSETVILFQQISNMNSTLQPQIQELTSNTSNLLVSIDSEQQFVSRLEVEEQRIKLDDGDAKF